MLKRIALPLLFALSFALPSVAHAQRRSPLADAPAIRKRVELRETRLELGAGFGTTINQTFFHGLMASVRGGFHLTDWLSISGTAAFDVSSISTGFHDALLDTLPAQQVPRPMPDFRAPSDAIADSTINKQKLILAGQLEVTPFTGKYSVFGALFAHYDFYLFGGVAGVNLAAAKPSGAPTCGSAAVAMGGSCVVTGTKVGATFGAGLHSFFNDFIALNVELRDLMIKDNPAGRDVNGDMNVNNGDLTWTQHFMATLGLTIYLPANAPVSN